MRGPVCVATALICSGCLKPPTCVELLSCPIETDEGDAGQADASTGSDVDSTPSSVFTRGSDASGNPSNTTDSDADEETSNTGSLDAGDEPTGTASNSDKTSHVDTLDTTSSVDTADSSGDLDSTADAVGCLDWSAPNECDTGACSSASACLVCDNRCSSGSFSCSGNQLNACTADAQGCYDYEPETTCGGNTPVCNADRGRCECESGAAPICKNGTTVSECSNGAWTDSACSGNEPVCVEGTGCVACTEHSQCPSSACHLSGSKKGTCFAADTVVNVNSAATLLSAVKATKANGEAVIKLSAGTYTVTEELAPNGETAIIGQAGVVIVDDMPTPSDGRAAFLYSPNTTYLAKFELKSSRPNHTGISPQTGGAMWLDDLKVHDVGTAVLTNGEAHVRRTSVYKYNSGLLAYYGGSLFVENSMIGPATGFTATGVGAYWGAVLDIRYSTIVGNEQGVGCTVGSSTGRIANSIIATWGGNSIADEYSDCSEAVSLVNNAVDQSGHGAKIPVYSSTWFVSANSGDLHLSAAGKVAIPTIAVRESGDPLSDFDGDARPASAGYPGADQP